MHDRLLLGYNADMQAFIPSRWVVVDLETTGMSPVKGDRIVEIGAVVVENGVITDEYSTLVDPERLIPYFVQRVHGISDAMVIGKPVFAQVLPSFLEFCQDSVLVSHNATFDRGFLDHQAQEVMQAPLPHAHVDTLRISRMLLPKLGKHNLDALTAHFQVRIPPQQRHRALGDARATAEIWIKMLTMAMAEGKSLTKGFIRPLVVN